MPFKHLHIPGHLYFVTATLTEWLPLFEVTSYASTVLESLNWHRSQKRLHLFAFVIMPTHLHWIGKPIEPHTIEEVLQSFSSFTAHEILKELRKDKCNNWLEIFASHAKPDKQHSIWQKPLAENIFSMDFLTEKLDYVHNNPVAKGLVANRVDFRYSSACFYDKDQTPIIPVDDVREII
jgi:putative transposase